MPTSSSALPVNLASVAHSKHQHEEPVVFDLVNDAIVARLYSPFACATDQLRGGGWAWLNSE